MNKSKELELLEAFRKECIDMLARWGGIPYLDAPLREIGNAISRTDEVIKEGLER